MFIGSESYIFTNLLLFVSDDIPQGTNKATVHINCFHSTMFIWPKK